MKLLRVGFFFIITSRIKVKQCLFPAKFVRMPVANISEKHQVLQNEDYLEMFIWSLESVEC